MLLSGDGGDYMTGLEIKMARLTAGLKGYELAAMLGITPDKMSRIEVGRLIPEGELLANIRRALNIN